MASSAAVPTRQVTRRDLIVGAACCAGAALGASASLWPEAHKLPGGGLAALVPKRIGPWSLARTDGIIVAEEREGRTGPYDDLLTRIYEAPGASPMTLLVAYVGSQRADVRLHRPEACYPAAGYTLRDQDKVRLSLPGTRAISAQMVLAESPVRSEEMLYWTRVGTEFPMSNVEQIAALVRSNLSGRVADGVLVRLSLPGSDRDLAWRTFQLFLGEWLAASSREAVDIIFGGA